MSLGSFAEETFTALLGGLATFFIVEREDKKKTLNPRMVRMEAPHYSKDQADEARFAQVVALLSSPLRKALLERWLPTLGENQKADFILTVAEMTVGDTPQERQENERRTLVILTGLARLPANDRRTKQAASLRFVRLKETDYKIVQLINAGKITPQKAREIANWMKKLAEAGVTDIKTAVKAFDSKLAPGPSPDKTTTFRKDAVERLQQRLGGKEVACFCF